jgi:hypothetical protein
MEFKSPADFKMGLFIFVSSSYKKVEAKKLDFLGKNSFSHRKTIKQRKHFSLRIILPVNPKL